MTIGFKSLQDQSGQVKKIHRRRENLRSVTGLASVEDGVGLRLLHYKLAPPKLVQREAEELHRVATTLETLDGITVLRLGRFPPDEGVLLSEYIPESQSLFNYLWNGSRWWAWNGFAAVSPEECGRRIGHWLHVYHASTLREQAEVQTCVAWIVDGAIAKLRATESRDPRCLPSDLTRRLRSYLDQTIGRAREWGPQSVAQIHGDLGAANILVNRQGKLFVTDFADTREGFALFDVIRIWHGVWAVSQTSALRNRTLRPFLDALLCSYGCPESVLQTPLVRLARLWNAVTLLLSAAMAPREFGWSGRYALRKLADVNRDWLLSCDWES